MLEGRRFVLQTELELLVVLRRNADAGMNESGVGSERDNESELSQGEGGYVLTLISMLIAPRMPYRLDLARGLSGPMFTVLL